MILRWPCARRARQLDETPSRAAVGVVLAGGRGLRMGGSKLSLVLCGRPLIAYPIAAMQAAVRDVAVIAKATSTCRRSSG